MTNEAKDMICVFGMHRSGTSLLANWLHDSGINMGENLVPSSRSNAKGHFEDLDFVNLHIEDLLRKRLSGSALLKAKGHLRFDDLSLTKMAKLVRYKNRHFPYWGWKDPRATLYADQWMEALPELKGIIVFRKPDQVVNSLIRRETKREITDRKKYRNPINILRSWYLFNLNRNALKNAYLKTYDLYNQQLITLYQKYPSRCIIISHDDLIHHNDQVKNQLESFISLPNSMSKFSDIYAEELLNSSQKGSDIRLVENSKTYTELLKLRT